MTDQTRIDDRELFDRSWIDDTPQTPEEEALLEKFDPDPNREPAGTTKTDSTGGGAGGQFAPKNGESAGGRAAPKNGRSGAEVVPRRGNNPPGKTILDRLARQRRERARNLRNENEASENGPDNEVYIPHTQMDSGLFIDQESSLDYEAELFFDDRFEWTEEEKEGIRYYYDALHASDLVKAESGNKIPRPAEEALRRVELELIGMDHERGYSIRPDGSTALKVEGERTRIKLDTIELSQLDRSYFTHSHPVERPPSPQDITVGILHKIPEVRAVTPTATYRWNFNDLVIDRADWLNAVDVEFQFIDWAIDSIGDVDDVTAAEMLKVQHAAMVRLADRFGSTYTRELHDA